MTELLLDGDLPAESRSMAETIRSCGDQLMRIIDDILDFSKIEAGKLRLETIDLDLRRLVEELGDVLAPRCEERGIELICHVPGDVPVQLRGDPSRLTQVLMNLGTNAVKFTQHGEVHIEATCLEQDDDRARLRIQVRDTGIGIPADRMNRLFQSFSQVDASTTRQYGGTGLGLAISKQLVDLMGGTIGVESEEGVGATFTVELTLEKQVHAAQREPRVPVDLEGLRVAVVDDNATNRTILGGHLASWACRPVPFAEPREALEELARAADAGRAFDLLLLDYHMPELDGLALARLLRRDPRTAHLPIVLLTSISFTADEPALDTLAIGRHLTKPVKASLLYEAIAAVLAAARPPSASQVDAPEGGPPEPSTAGQGAPARLGRVLLVEDNEMNQRVAEMLLRRNGYECTLAQNGAEALEAWEQGEFDLVLMDCQMPVMDGYEAARAIREREAADDRPRTPILAMTANALQGARERCLAAGMNDYVTKPIEVKRLLALLHVWISDEGDERHESA
jgi:CheY-like chemotaxis protein/anti-sigma regulatory factor (Ser/Thr protein kinase)